MRRELADPSRSSLVARGLVGALVLGTAACASVLGFEDPLDLPAAEALTTDGGIDPGTSCHCAPTTPSGWTGPLVLRDGTNVDPASACDAAYPKPVVNGFVSPAAAAASCGCACGDPTGVTCSAPTLTLFSDGACANGCSPPQALPANTCVAVDRTGCGNNVRGIYGETIPSGGACAPVPSVLVPPVVGEHALLCGLESSPLRGTCDEGRSCVPSPRAPFGLSVCIAREGSWACPAEFPRAHTYHAASVDTRHCTACTCEAPTGVTCDGALTAHNVTTCASTGVSRALESGCISVNNDKGARFTVTPTGGSCTATGGIPAGHFDPGVPTTVCCAL